MIIEAVTVCVDYADLLAETVRHNQHLVDRWIVVTSPRDEATRAICHRHELECVLSEDHSRNGAPFNKGRMIERGLTRVSRDAWRLHLDADIVLPSSFRRMLDAAHLDEQKIYGVDRAMVHSYAEWREVQSSGWMANSHHCQINFPRALPIGTRWGSAHHGYVPIGFFQLWHALGDEWRGIRFRKYPTSHSTACRTDVQFALSWDRRLRELLGEFIVVHLESCCARTGANWHGRKTPPFGPHGPSTNLCP